MSYGSKICITLGLCAASCATAAPSELGPAVPTVEYVTHQEILAPLPLRVRMPAASGTEHVIVLVRASPAAPRTT